MQLSFYEDSRPRYKNGRIVFCKPDSQESKEWAPFQFATACKTGEELKVIQLDANGGTEEDVMAALSAVEGPCCALFQDWAGATVFQINKG